MADNTIINCAQSGSIFTGVSACSKFDTGDIRGIFASRKGTNLVNDTTFATKFIEEFRKNKILYFSAYEYDQPHEENQFNTSSLGNMLLQRLGKPMLQVDVAFASVCEAKEISKINNSSTDWDIWLVYENAIVCATKSNGNFIGFDANSMTAESTKLKQGSNYAVKQVKAQLKSSTQYNEGMTLIPFTDALAELKELTGIIRVKIDVAITDGTHLDVTITDACSGNGIEGLTTSSNFQVLGVQASATTISTIVSNGDGNYTFTITPTLVNADTIGLKLATSGFECVTIDGAYYGGASELQTMS